MIDVKQSADKSDILSMTKDELTAELAADGMPKYRAAQIYDWVYRGAGFSEMSNLPAETRRTLDENYFIRRLSVERRLISRIDGTEKYLFALGDGNFVESVLMRYHHGNSICISTQVGCRMGCAFCASTKGGLVRNLEPSEMLAQITGVQDTTGERISNVVLMGIGEPLDNYVSVLKFLRLLNAPEGLNIGFRHVSLSTCGLVDKIDSLAEENLPITLSVSLHAPNDEIRSRIMPVNAKWNIEALLKSCRRYADRTGRRISYEYTLISGVNDSHAHAIELARRLRGMPAHVNLIAVNKIREAEFSPGGHGAVQIFSDALRQHGINATLRRRLGADIDASCGQLRSEAAGKCEKL